ncbi:hypothetical protein CPB83DRAFT_146627 [Crepidotus variabilis]|uniref:DUF6697 domain-containing protein n=1 Tax=Crepidotus variabilis TaxID=179855 RepID=A0A9P6ELC0_9AGAR|nr:hypothetical protein CPB83DRAFT_146627 [Crepidotus variabilis]
MNEDTILKTLPDGHSNRRQRLMVEVVVPTLKEVMQRKRNEAALKAALKKPKLKKQEGERESLVGQAIIDSRLALIGGDKPFEIGLPRAMTDQSVTREFMARTYGGSMQATCPTIGEKNRRRHNYDNFTYLHPAYHPHAPLLPGRPGLFFCCSGGGDWPGLQRVFVRDPDPKLTIWTYLGQYDIKSCPSLTKEEWKSLTIQIRAHWGNEICRQRWGGDVLLRIQARKELMPGQQLTERLLQRVQGSNRWKTVTPLEVTDAYDRGEEHIGVWTLKCVGYDEKFQRELCAKFPGWAPPIKEEEKSQHLDGVKPKVKILKQKNPALPQQKHEDLSDDKPGVFES